MRAWKWKWNWFYSLWKYFHKLDHMDSYNSFVHKSQVDSWKKTIYWYFIGYNKTFHVHIIEAHLWMPIKSEENMNQISILELKMLITNKMAKPSATTFPIESVTPWWSSGTHSPSSSWSSPFPATQENRPI